MKKQLFLLLCALLTMIGVQAETDYTNLMPDTWTNQTGGFQGGSERYQNANYESGKVMFQNFEAPADGIYEIKFYAVASSTSGRGFDNISGPNIAQAYVEVGESTTVLDMYVYDQTGCTLVQDANIRTLSIEAQAGETIEYGLKNIATGGNWYTIKALSAKMKTVAEIFQAQYDEAYAIWEHSTESEAGARATFKSYVDALLTAMSGTLAQAQTASDNLAAALIVYEGKSYPEKGSGVKYDFTSKMNMAINAWTCKQGNGPAQYGFTGATETYKGSAYNAGEVMYQTITGLANGEYEIHFYAVANSPRSESASGPDIAYVYANNQTVDIDVIAQDGCTPSDYERTITVMVTDGTIKYGISNKAAGGNWYVAKNVALYMTGAPDVSDYRAAVAAKLEVAEGLVNEVMNADVETDLNDKIDATDGYEESTDIVALEQMANNLDAAIAAAQTSIVNYQEAAAIINAASTLDEAGQAVYNSNNKVLEVKATYEARTLEAVTDEQKADCQAAFIVATKAQTTPESDWTAVIQNNSFETGNLTGWTAASTAGDTGVKSNSNATYHIDNADGNYLFNTWDGDATGYAITQTLPDMPCGVYRLTARFAGRVDGQVDLIAGSSSKTFTQTATGTGTDVDVTFTVAISGEDVTIGTANATSWYKVDYFRLALVEIPEAADADDYAALNAAIKNAESMKVGFKAGEYAPYTNVAVLAPLAAAKAIDQTAVNAKSAVVIATSLLNDAQSSWVENTENMPIVYNGTFVASENNGAPAGWETDNAAGLGGALHARAFVLNPEDGNYEKLASFDQDDVTRSAFYVRFDGTNSTRTTDYTYGETVGYTMPLEAGVYRVKLMAGGWGKTQPLNVKFEDAEGIIKGEQTVNMTNLDDGSGVAASFNFLSEVEAGDYKLVVSNGNIEADNAVAFSNVQITLEITAADLETLRDEIINLRTQVEGYTELPEPLATEATDAVAEAYGYINEHECDPALLNACKNRLQAVVDAVEAAAWQAQIADAQALAADDDAVAVGKLRDAIEDAIIIIVPTDEQKAALQAAVDQFNLDNADQESDQTAKVATDGWKKFDGSDADVCDTQYAPAIDTYDGRKNVKLAESYQGSWNGGVETTGDIIYQDIAGLTNGTYKVGFYGNAFFTPDREMESSMEDGATDVAYVFANDQQEFITARIATSTTENNFREFDVEVTDGTIHLGMGKAKAGTNWHTMQIYQLTWFTSAKALYALDKADMEAAILLAGTLYEDPYKTNGKEELQQAIAEANAARISNHLNIAEFETEIAKLNAAIEAFKVANYVAFNGTFYVKNAAGKFMAAGHNWGTRGIVNEKGLDLTLTPNNENKVKIDSRVSNGGDNHFLSEGLYMDGAAFAWAIEQVGAEEYSISNGTKYIGVDAEDNLALVNEPFAWQFLDAATVDAGRLADGLAAMAAATADNGVDATFLLKDADFNRNDLRQEAWTKVQGQTGAGHSMNLGGGGANGYGCAEAYHTDFTVSQVVANAPAGVYKLSAQGFYRQDEAAEEAIPVFYIGDATAEVPVKTGTENDMNAAGASFAAGNYEIEPVEFVFDGEGDLEVGIRGTAVNQWVIWDNFRLTYFGAAPAPKTDYTDHIVNADLTGTDPKGFDDAGTKGIDGSGIVKAGNNAQFDFKQTISLPAGQYKLTAQAAYRYSNTNTDDEQKEYDAIANGETTKFASLYATIGEKTVSTLVQNRYDGASETDYAAGSGSVVVNEKYVPNSSAAVQAWFNAGQYVNEVTFNLTADGNVTIGIEKTAQPEVGDYTVIGPWKLTRLGDAQPEYAITVAPAENGNVVADKVTAAAGETVKVTATPDEGYMVDYGYYVYNETQYDFESIDMEHNIATFTMPAGPVSVVLAFKQAKVAYQFVPSEWGAGDAGRISPENVVADDEAGTITVDKTGANNVNLNFHTTKRYVLSASQRYFVIKATGLATGDTDSYLWWLNHNNNGSQIVPTAIFVENGETVFAWDAITSGIGGTIGLEETELNGTAELTTTFGMTLADDAVPAVISYIGFQETIPEPVEEFAYEFVPSEWVAGDAGRISPENVTADDDMCTITVNKTGDNNVNLNFKTNKLYYVENVDYFVIKAKGVSTEAGASLLWWLNGKNDGGLSFEPTSTATEDDDTIILEWKISECGNIGENINPVGKSYLLGGEGWTTTFGLTQADALTPVVISYIGYGTKSATAISAAKSHNGEGALKDGKYLIKGEIVIVKNGKLYKANGQLK